MSAGTVETEIKLRISDHTAARKLLEQKGFSVSRARIFEANSIYDLPGGELHSRGQLLRLRLAGDRAVLTWKGPLIEGPHKSRPETEVGVADFELCDRLLVDLGYVLVFKYSKYRTELQNEAKLGTVTLDETPIGDFLELEGPPNWIDQTARDLGFSTSDYINASYVTLYMEDCKNRQVQPGFMIFQNQE